MACKTGTNILFTINKLFTYKWLMRLERGTVQGREAGSEEAKKKYCRRGRERERIERSKKEKGGITATRKAQPSEPGIRPRPRPPPRPPRRRRSRRTSDGASADDLIPRLPKLTSVLTPGLANSPSKNVVRESRRNHHQKCSFY